MKQNVVDYKVLFRECIGMKKLDCGEVVKKMLDTGIDTLLLLTEYRSIQQFLQTTSVHLQIGMLNYLQQKQIN